MRGHLGAGAVQLLNGLYDAKLDHQPVLAIVGQQKRVSLGADWLQEVELHTLLQDVGEYVQTCMAPEQPRHLIDRAMRTAITSRTRGGDRHPGRRPARGRRGAAA